MPADVSELLALSDDLKSSGRKVRAAVGIVVHKTAEEVENDMKAAAPARTGALRDSITASGSLLTQTVNVGIRYAVFVMYGSVHNPSPVDFLNPAADSAQTTFPPEVREAVVSAMGL